MVAGRTLSLAFLAACLVMVRGATGAQPAEQTRAGGDRIALTPVVELARLVDLASERLGVSVEYDSRLSGSVTLRLQSDVTDAELWRLTNRLLASRDFTSVRMAGDGTLSIVPIGSAASLAAVEDAAGVRLDEPAGPGFRVVRVGLRSRGAEEVAAAIKPLLSAKGGAATALPELRAVLVADLSPRLGVLLRAIETLEAGGVAEAPLEVHLERLGAAQVIALSEQLNAKRAEAGAMPLAGSMVAGPTESSVLVIAPAGEHDRWRALLTLLDRGESLHTATYDASGLAVGEVAASIERLIGAEEGSGFGVEWDELTASLVVTGTPVQHARVEELLERLPRAPEAARRPTRTFRLLNRDAEEVAEIVQSLISGGMFGGQPAFGAPVQADGQGEELDATSPQWGWVGGAPPMVRVDGEAGASLQVAADPATNSIIAMGSAQELDRLGTLLADLDVRRPQVLLEVLIISLSESDSMDLGVEIEALIDGPNETVGKLSSLFGLSGTGAGASAIEGNRGAGLTGIVLNPGDFSVVLRALRTLNEGRSLSMPKVLVASNEQATINSVLEQPYTTINASDTVATTSFGGSSNAGTEVSVRPQIAEGDHLRLEYSVSLSAFVGEAADASVPPPKQQNNIDSVATIPDGYTIAVGGIELTTAGDAETGIPFISDIPILGEAFKNRSKTDTRSRFYVFIRPTILRDTDFEDLKHLSDLDVAGTGVDDGWPEVKPRVIR